MKYFTMTFNGAVLKRGFWLYVWDIRGKGNRYLYVGRTGDSASANAASPFSRIGRHLDFRSNAKGNSMARLLKKEGIDPASCTFKMVAIGPIFSEQKLFSAHRPYRDTMATLEFLTAEHLRNKGHRVLGSHQKSKATGSDLFNEVVEIIGQRV